MALDLPADAVLFLCPEDRKQKRKTRARLSYIEFRHLRRECQSYALVDGNLLKIAGGRLFDDKRIKGLQGMRQELHAHPADYHTGEMASAIGIFCG